MLKNYLKIALRNLLKNGLFSVVNSLGLTAGILFTLLIGAYVWGEWQVNKSLKNTDKQYFLSSKWKQEGMGLEITTLAPISKRLKEEYPSLVANYYRWDGITSVVSKGDKHFREGIQVGDSTLLSMYGFELAAGNPRTAWLNPYSMVIMPEQALKYFGKIDVVGQTLNIQSFSGENHDFMITGVLKNLPENTVTKLNKDNKNGIFISNNTAQFFGRDNFEDWTNVFTPSYLELREGVTAKDLEKPIQQLIAQNAPDFVKANLIIVPVSLNDYYLQKDKGLVIRMLVTLSLIGLFILLMAVVNFINISISSSVSRTKEIGVRKALGGIRLQLVFQFLTESLILVTLSAVLALLLYPVIQPLFTQLIGKQIPDLGAFPAYFALIFTGFVFFVGFLAGLYPAFVLSSLQTIASLKGKLNTANDGILLRKTLVAFQFATVLLVLIGATVITQQVNHFFGKDLGYNKEFVVSAQVPRDWSKRGVQKMESIRKEFEKMPQISTVSLSYEIPNGNNGGQPSMYKLGADSTQTIASQSLVTDENYLKTYEIDLKAGEFFGGMGRDSAKVILNEKAIQQLSFKNPAEAIGQKIRLLGDPTIFTIKGVTTDFQFGSMQQAIQPMVFFDVNTATFYRFLSFKIKPNQIKESVAAIQSKWATLMPQSAFEYTFMDESLKMMYQNEIQLQKAAYTATILAIIISLLGVIGLIALSIQKRIKEIGVRKVLGASSLNIITLFIKEFAGVFAVACAVACPIAYFLMDKWLNNYANRVTISLLSMLWAIIVLMTLTVVLIGLQTIKAALMNPVSSLKSE